MNAFFDSVESQNAESTEQQQYVYGQSETSGNNYSDALLDAFESDIADYDRDYDDPDTVESKIRVIQMQSVSAEKSAACSFRFRVELSA